MCVCVWTPRAFKTQLWTDHILGVSDEVLDVVETRMSDQILFWDTSTSAVRVFLRERESSAAASYYSLVHVPLFPRAALRTACVCVLIALVGPLEPTLRAPAFAAASTPL